MTHRLHIHSHGFFARLNLAVAGNTTDELCSVIVHRDLHALVSVVTSALLHRGR